MQSVPLGVTCRPGRAEGLETGMASQGERVRGGKKQGILVVTMFRGWGEGQEPNGRQRNKSQEGYVPGKSTKTGQGEGSLQTYLGIRWLGPPREQLSSGKGVQVEIFLET